MSGTRKEQRVASYTEKVIRNLPRDSKVKMAHLALAGYAFSYHIYMNGRLRGWVVRYERRMLAGVGSHNLGETIEAVWNLWERRKTDEVYKEADAADQASNSRRQVRRSSC